MILAPRMIQAMEILQLPLMALQERIDQELIANPVLEMHTVDPEAPAPEPESDEAAASVSPEAADSRDLVVRDDGDNQEDFARLSEVVDRWEGYMDDEVQWRRSRPSSGDPDRKAEAMQNTPDDGESLQEHMLHQWHLEDAPPRVSELGDLVIRNLDDNGYVRVPLDELASEVDPPAAPEEMEDALLRVQRVGPTGVAARGISECLLLQLRAVGGGNGSLPDDALVVRLVRDHLRDIEANRYPHLSKTLGVPIDEIKQAVEIIRRLNPKPGTVVSGERTPTIIPDVKIEWDEEVGEYRITIEKGDAPELYISRVYRRLVKQQDLDAKTRQFVMRNIRSARWLMDAIEQRRDTLRRVVESIVRLQRPFFDEGPDHIQPLKMQQVADDVGLHVGTISRAVADKYADTSWGIYALRSFFLGGTQDANGEDVSWDQVRIRLEAMVDEEDKTKPLSDEQIMKRFQEEGVDVARRTVAKYREELGIPSSRKRRQY